MQVHADMLMFLMFNSSQSLGGLIRYDKEPELNAEVWHNPEWAKLE